MPQMDGSADVNQFAYKSNRSTLDAVDTLYHNTAFSPDKGSKVIMCAFFDYSSAFNTIPRSQILMCLDGPRNGFQTTALAKRSMFPVEDKCRARFQITMVCSKGAGLSPFLFSFHLDSLMCNGINLIKYADDLILSGKCKTAVDFNVLSISLVTISHWSRAHGIQLNSQKCIQCDFALTRSQTPSIPQLALDGTILPSANEFKYLDVSFSSDLAWACHVENITSRCHPYGFVLKRLRSFSIPQYAICRFVDACVLPTILYCSPVFLSALLQKEYMQLRRSIRSISCISESGPRPAAWATEFITVKNSYQRTVTVEAGHADWVTACSHADVFTWQCDPIASATYIGCWNVRTWKTVEAQTLTVRTLHRYKTDIACLSEVRLGSSGHISIPKTASSYHIY